MLGVGTVADVVAAGEAAAGIADAGASATVLAEGDVEVDASIEAEIEVENEAGLSRRVVDRCESSWLHDGRGRALAVDGASKVRVSVSRRGSTGRHYHHGEPSQDKLERIDITQV